LPKIIQYRNKCIGCCICAEMQPQFWKMSKKDGKAVLLHSENKNSIFILKIPATEKDLSLTVADACPVKIIKVV
jgi:ferredoxin